MKAITGSILVVAAAIFLRVRVDVASSPIGIVEAKELVRISQAASLLFGIAGVLLIGMQLLQSSGIIRRIFSAGRLLPPPGSPGPSRNVDANNQQDQASSGRECSQLGQAEAKHPTE